MPVTVMPGSQKCSPNSHRKPHANLLRVFDVCLEMPSDSKNYFDFLLDEISELVHTIKSLGCCHLENICDQTAGHGLKLTQ